jgi:hypothetical protein
MMYIDDGAIYATSATTIAAAESAVKGYNEVLNWLKDNGLEADLAKTKLMTFKQSRSNPNLIGGHVHGARYVDPAHSRNKITMVKHVKYLGVHITHDLKWTCHVEIMANRARSTIKGINVLGNSVRGLNFLNWRKVYNALIIPVLTYGVHIWYTSVNQKGLINCLQVTQNDRIRKITGVFKTTPTEPVVTHYFI